MPPSSPAAYGFTIVDYDGSADVELLGDHFRVTGGDREYLVSLYSYQGLVAAIADRLISQWRPRGDDPPPRWLRSWKLEKTRRIFGKQIHAEWSRLLEQVDPTVLAMQRAMFAATFDQVAAPLAPEAYADEHIVHDVVTYRAAAVVAARLNLLTRQRPLQVSRQIQNSEAFKRLAHEHGIASELLSVVPTERGMRPPAPAVPHAIRPRLVELPGGNEPDLRVLREWRGTLSVSGWPYRSLNRTLDELPGGIPVPLLLRLRMVELERPITQRLELLALLHVADQYGAPLNLPVFMHATAGQIRRAAQLVIESNRWGDMSLRRTANVGRVIRYLQDYPDEHTGNIVGLAEKSIRWHRERQDEVRQRVIEQFGGDHETARPPVNLPSIDGVTFLASVGEVAEEGASMGHCLASYAQRAVSGDCFLFHIEHAGETASVHVDWAGRVVQSYGPRNTPNAAAEWGTRVLSRWGDGFPAELPRPIENVPLAPPHPLAFRVLEDPVF